MNFPITATGSGLPVTVHLNAYHGDTFTQSFRFRYGDNPVDLTGADIRSKCRDADNDEYPMAVHIDDPTGGLFHLELAADLGPDLYDYDIQLAAQGVVTTWVRGRLNLQGDITL